MGLWCGCVVVNEFFVFGSARARLGGAGMLTPLPGMLGKQTDVKPAVIRNALKFYQLRN